MCSTVVVDLAWVMLERVNFCCSVGVQGGGKGVQEEAGTCTCMYRSSQEKKRLVNNNNNNNNSSNKERSNIINTSKQSMDMRTWLLGSKKETKKERTAEIDV
jgi:hypothetical protein